MRLSGDTLLELSPGILGDNNCKPSCRTVVSICSGNLDALRELDRLQGDEFFGEHPRSFTAAPGVGPVVYSHRVEALGMISAVRKA